MASKNLLAACFTACLVAANIVASKVVSFTLPVVGDITAPAGFIGIAVAFLFSDLLGELHGESTARSVVNSAIGGLLVAYGVVYSAVLLPAAPFYGLADPFNQIMGAGSTIVVASIVTLLVSQNLDVTIFHKLKEKSDVRAVRNVGSTVLSQFVDTALFIGLAFVVLPYVLAGDPMTVAAAAPLVFSQYIAKVGVALLDTPVFYAVSELAE